MPALLELPYLHEHLFCIYDFVTAILFFDSKFPSQLNSDMKSVIIKVRSQICHHDFSNRTMKHNILFNLTWRTILLTFLQNILIFAFSGGSNIPAIAAANCDCPSRLLGLWKDSKSICERGMENSKRCVTFPWRKCLNSSSMELRY